MVLTHLHIVIFMEDTLYIEFTLIFTETIAYQCCNHTFSTNLKGEDSDSDCEENEDDLPPAFAFTQQNVCSTFTEHEVQNGLEERDSCTVNTILPYNVQQNPSVEQRPATCHSDDNHSNPSGSSIVVPVYWKKGLHVQSTPFSHTLSSKILQWHKHQQHVPLTTTIPTFIATQIYLLGVFLRLY